MYDIPTYNHSKPKNDPTNRVSIFYAAAKISLAGSILGWLLLRGAEYGLKDTHSAGLVLGLGAVTVVVDIVCFVLGVFALCGMLKYGMHGILVRAVCGILISGMFLGMFGVGFARGFQAALKQRQLVARARTTSDQSGNGPDQKSSDGSTSAKGLNSPDAGVNARVARRKTGFPQIRQ
jgi:hypothetical protein